MVREVYFSIDPDFSEKDERELSTMGFNCKKIMIMRHLFNLVGISDIKFDVLINYLKTKKYKIDFSFDKYTYDQNELQDFDYFLCDGQIVTETRIQLSPSRYDGNPCFDYSNYCDKCASGLNQIAPLHVSGVDKIVVRRKKIVTPYWEYWLIDDVLKGIMEDAELSGIDYLPIYTGKGIKIDGIWQIKPKKKIEECFVSECYRGGTVKDNECSCNNPCRISFNDENNILIKSEKKTILQDFNESSERRMTTRGAYIISKKMMNILIESASFKQIKKTYYCPITFV